MRMTEMIILEITNQCFNYGTNQIKSNEIIHKQANIDNELMYGMVESALYLIKCLVDATINAVNDTDLLPIWEAIEAIDKDITTIVDRLKACRNNENTIDEIR